jgi:acyl carrier protein
MSSFVHVQTILTQVLQLGSRGEALTPTSPLLGAIPELDSMAVQTILVAFEDHFGFTINDDEISATLFETVGSLTTFVDQKLNQG